MIKLTILLVRKPSLSREQFIEHHRDVHAALFMSIPVVQRTVRRYVQQHAVNATVPGLPPTKYDGITELWFDNVEELAQCFADTDYLAKIRPDEESFLNLHACDFVISKENLVAG